MKNNLLSKQIKKIISKNENVIILFIDRDGIVRDKGIEVYKAGLSSSFSIFLDKEEFKKFKIFNINTDKHSRDIIEFLYGVDIFPLGIVFEKSIPKFVVPISFD
jgi:hypothetical protein